MSRSILLLLGVALAMAPVIAGCLSPSAPTEAPPAAQGSPPMNETWYLAALNHEKDHNHKDITQHQNMSTPNFKLLGHDFLLTDAYQGKPAYGYGCGGIATRADGHRFVVINGFQNDLTFVLVDVTDASAPKKVGEFYAKNLGSYDADVTPDGKYVVLAFDGLYRAPGSGPGVASALPEIGFRSACGNQVLAFPDTAVTNGIVLIDIKDPAKPTYADFDPSPGFNLHSVSTARIDNVTWVVGSELGFTHSTSYFVFDNIMDTPLGAKLVRVSTFDSPPVTKGDSAAVALTNGHTDVVMSKHPVTKKTLAYIADWEGGVITLDMSIPQAPVIAAMWTPPAASPTADVPTSGGFFDSGPCYHNAIHEVLPAEDVWEGRHIIFAGQECPMKVDLKTPGGQVFVIDDTDPTAPKTIGEWHLPADTGVWTVEYQASPHYLALHNRTLFISDYHAGIWAADVSKAELLKSPPSIGVFVPAITPTVPPAKPEVAPMDEQVDVFPDGTIVLNEDTTGLYVVQFDASNPAPAAPGYKYG